MASSSASTLDLSGLYTVLVSKMIEYGFKNQEEKSFAIEVSQSFLAENLAKSLVDQGILSQQASSFPNLTQLQEVSHDTP